MAGAVDTRVVQMQFDNKDFERNVKTSEKTLERFKEHLDFSKCEKGLNEFSNATQKLNFDHLTKGVDALVNKFTGLGTVSEHILSQLRRGIDSTVQKISHMVNELTLAQIPAGKDKFEQLNRNVQTIMGATGEAEDAVYKVMERLNAYTDQTSYNFSDMAANIGKFTSVGIDLRDAEKQMEGIANWAARSGAGIQEASRAMYNLSQAMGVGKMTTIDWKSIENAGMATKEFKDNLIEAGLAMGTLEIDNAGNIKTAKSLGKQVEVNYQNLRDTLKKGWANRETMETALMGYYYDDLYYEGEKTIQLTEEQLKKNEELFKDHQLDLSEWKTLSDQGIMTQEAKQALIDIAVQQKRLVKETDKNGKTIYKTVKKNGKDIEVTLESFEQSLSYGWLDKTVASRAGIIKDLGEESYKAAQKCTTLTDVFNAWKDQLSTGWMKFWQKIFGNLSESMELFSTICNKVGDAFSGFIRLLVGGEEKLEDGSTKIYEGIFGAWERLGGRNSLWSLFVGEYDGMYEGAYGFLDVLSDIGQMISNGFWLMIKSMNPSLSDISDEDWLANEAYRTEFLGYKIKEFTEKVRGFIEGIRDWFNTIPEGDTETRAQKIQKIINGIFSIAVFVSSAMKDIAYFFDRMFGTEGLLRPAIDAVIDILESLGITIRNTAEDTAEGKGLRQFFDQLLEHIKPLTDAINHLFQVFSKFFSSKNEKGENRITKFWTLLCEVFGKIMDVVAKVAGPVIDFVSNMLDIINLFFTEGINKETLQKAGTILSDAFQKLFGDIFGLFPEYAEKIEKFFAYIFGFADSDAEEQADGSGKTILGVVKEWLHRIFGGVGQFVEDAKNEVGNVNLFSFIKEELGIGLLGKFIGGLSGLVKGTNLYGIIMAFLGGYALFKLIKLFRQGSGLLKQTKGFMKNLKDAFSSDHTFSLRLESTGDKILKIAKAVAILVGAVAVLGYIPLDKLVQGAAALVIIMGVLAGFVFVMTRIGKSALAMFSVMGVLVATAAAIIAITIGISILILALKPLANMNLLQIGSMVLGLAGILGVLAYFSKKVSFMKGSGMGSFVMVALSVALLVHALKPLANMNLLQIGKMVSGLFGVLEVLQIFSHKVAFMKGSGMGSLVMVALSVMLLMNSLRPLADMEWGNLAKVGAGLVVVMGVLLWFTKKAAYMRGSGMGSLLVVALTIVILLEALKPLANYSWENLGKMGAGLLLLMFILTKFTIGVQSMKSTGMGQLVAVAVAIWVIVQALRPLANYEWGDLAKMAAGLVLLAIVTVLMARFLKPASDLNGKATALVLLGLAAIFAAFALVLLALNGKNLKWENIATACAGLIIILLLFGSIIMTMSQMKMKDTSKMIPMLVALVGLAVVMLAFSFALNEIKNVDTGKIAAFSAALSAILVVFTVALTAVSKLSIGAALKGILILSAGLAALMGVIALIAPMVIGSIGNALRDLSENLVVMSNMLEIFTGRIGRIDEGNISKAESMIYRLKDMMTGLGSFIGFKSNIDAFTTSIYSLGTGLENFSWHLARAGDLSAHPVVQLIEDLAGSANGIDTITKINLDTFTRKLTGIAGALMLYAEGVKQVAQEGGLTTPEDIDDDAVSAAVTLVQAITKKLVGEDGLVIPENMPTADDFGLFGAQLAALAGALLKFEEAGKDLSGGIANGLAILDRFVELKQKLTDTDFVNTYNSVTGTFKTENISTSALEELGKNIEELGSSLQLFYEKTTFKDAEGNVKDLNFDSALDTLQAFVDMKEKMPNVGGVLGFWFGEKLKLDVLGAEIEGFANSLVSVSDKLVGTDETGKPRFDETSVGIVEAAVGHMVTILETLRDSGERVGGIVQIVNTLWNGREMNLEDLGKQIGYIGDGLGALGSGLSKGGWKEDIGADKALSALESLMHIFVYFKELDKEGYDDSTWYAVLLSNFMDALTLPNQNTGDMSTVEKMIEMMGKIHAAFEKYGDIDPARIEMFKTMAEALMYLSEINPETDWEKIGQSIAEGVKSGIEAGTSGVIDAAVAMAVASYKAVKDALDINSPSRKTEELGVNEVEGLIEGEQKALEQKAPELKETAKQELKWNEDDFDGEPSISDALEKYNVQAKVPEEAEVHIQVTAETDSKSEEVLNQASSLTEGNGNLVSQLASAAGIDLPINLSTDGQSMEIMNTLAQVQDGNADINLTAGVQPIQDQTYNAEYEAEKAAMIESGMYLNGAGSYASQVLPIDYTESLTSIKNELSNMRDDLKGVLTSLYNIKFALNTGELVAAIGPEMDEYLGSLGYQASRSDVP